MGAGKRNSNRRVLRRKDGRQKDQDKIRWCESAPIECTCLGTCNQKGQR